MDYEKDKTLVQTLRRIKHDSFHYEPKSVSVQKTMTLTWLRRDETIVSLHQEIVQKVPSLDHPIIWHCWFSWYIRKTMKTVLEYTSQIRQFFPMEGLRSISSLVNYFLWSQERSLVYLFLWSQEGRLLDFSEGKIASLLAMIALSLVQSSARTFMHNAISFTNTSNNAWYNQSK